MSLVVLGPQRLYPTVGPTMDEVLPDARKRGCIAVISAGWEERENEDRELAEHLRARIENLGVYGRVEEIFHRDPELFRALLRRHDRLRAVQEYYRLRLAHALDAARELLQRAPERPDDEPWLEAEREEAIESVRLLDANHFRRIHEIHAEFDAAWLPGEREHVRSHRGEIAEIVRGAAAVCVAGGHVAILLNRMRLLGLGEILRERPVFAWSAGAMALAERVVVFHDNPPQGAGDPEVLEVGLGLLAGVVPLPHARKRLRLDDPVRVGLFARRFRPAACIALDPHARLDVEGRLWRAGATTQRLNEDGSLSAAGENA